MNYDPLLILGNITLILILGWLSPGPNMLAVISASVSNGRRSGITVGLGLAVGGALWATLAVTGVVTVFELFPSMVLTLRLGGAAYLIWLGIKTLRKSFTPLTAYQSDLQGWEAFRTGFIVTMTNPKAALFFGSILTAFVPLNASAWLLTAIVAIALLQGFAGHAITATVFSTTLAVNAFQKASRTINTLFGTIFCAIGIGVAYDALKRF
ncbi:MAG: LysE family translocator [Alphaproteobacteria bacterium]